MSLTAALLLAAETLAPSPRRDGAWDASLRAGYGVMFTTGVSSVGAGAGPSIGYVFGSRFRLELAALWSNGSSERASNATFSYRSSYASMHVTAGAGYEIALGPLRITPGARFGGLRIEGTTHDGTAKFHEERWLPILGPSLLVVARMGRVELGLDGEAFYLPTWVASPVAAVYATGGMRF